MRTTTGRNLKSEVLNPYKGERRIGSRKEFRLCLDEEIITIERDCKIITTTFHVLRKTEYIANTVYNKYKNRYSDKITFINKEKVLFEKWTIVKVDIK